MKFKLLLILLLCTCFNETKGQGTPATATPQTYYLFIGTYTWGKPGKGIYVYRFNSDNGKLTKVSSTEKIINPSFLTISPNGKFVYACTETKMPNAGSVSAFVFDSISGKLKFINKQPSGGENPVYVTVDKTNKWVIDANYTEGSVSAFEINRDGSLNPASQTIMYNDSSINKDRQERSHIHAAVFSPQQDYLFFPDLGADKIRIYAFDSLNKQPLQPAQIPFVKTKPGSGPRHFTFHPNGKFAYCIEELSGTVSAYSYDNGQLDTIQKIFSYSRQQDGYASADIHVSPDGLFLYASNREDENTISIFSIDQTTGRLTLAGHQYTSGFQPRNFVIDPTGKFLLVANVSSGNVVVFKRNLTTGLLSKTGIKIHVPNPSCLQIRKYGQ
jgi:6-phosphogluconolactonase